MNIPIITEPGSSKKNKTGKWRTMKPVVNAEKCVGCGICAGFCPDSAIEIKNKKITIDYDYCKGCGICAVECPARTIFMKEEEK